VSMNLYTSSKFYNHGPMDLGKFFENQGILTERETLRTVDLHIEVSCLSKEG
jgi:hypothetical protein